MSHFSHNSADIGGAIGTVNNVTFTFNGTNLFVNNSARDNGGAIYAVMNASLRFIATNTFTHNSAGIKVGAADNGVLTFNGTDNFINNSANSGGAIFATTNISLRFTGTNNFTHNSAGIKGGAVATDSNGAQAYLQWNQQLHQQFSKQRWCNFCSKQRG